MKTFNFFISRKTKYEAVSTLLFRGIVVTKFDRRHLSRLLKMYQFTCSDLTVKIWTMPELDNIDKYNLHDSNSTLREEVMNVVRMLSSDNYEVRVEMKILF